MRVWGISVGSSGRARKAGVLVVVLAKDCDWEGVIREVEEEEAWWLEA